MAKFKQRLTITCIACLTRFRLISHPFDNLHRIPTGPSGFITVPIPIPTGIPISMAALDNRVYRSDMLWTCCRLQLVVQQIHRRSTGLHTSQPLYRSELISHYIPPKSLRSSNTNLLTRPAGITSNFSSRAFSVSAPSTWNYLPTHIRSIDTLSIFKRHLKFHLFHALCLYRLVILCQRIRFVLVIFGAMYVKS